MKELSSEGNYLEALKRLEVLFDAPIGSAESDEADLIADAIGVYEDKHDPISLSEKMD